MGRKIVIAAFDFIPYVPSFGAAQRVYFMARHFAEMGDAVEVICAQGREVSTFGMELDAEKFTVFEFPSRIARGRSARTIASEATSGKRTSESGWWRILRVIKSGVPIDYSFLSFFPFIKLLIRRVSRGDVLIVSGPPHGLMAIAATFRLFRHFKLVLDYRDGWNSQDIFRSNSKLGRVVSRWVEKFCLRKADLVSFVSPEFPRLLSEKMGVDIGSKAVLAMNGWVPQESGCAQELPDDGVVRMAYFGVANDRPGHYRNIVPIVQSLSGFLKSGALEIHLYGQFEASDATMANLPPAVRFMGAIPAKEVIARASAYQLLLLVHLDPRSVDEAIPAKLFDYLASRQPIVCVSAGEGAAARLIRSIDAGIVVSPDELREAFSNLLGSNGIPVCDVPESTIDSFQRSRQYSILRDAIADRLA